MTDEQLIHNFENDTFPDDSFHHADHVRLAYAYLSEYPVLAALGKFVSALKRFAAARGKTQLYNESLRMRSSSSPIKFVIFTRMKVSSSL
jgi:hypothetical protein